MDKFCFDKEKNSISKGIASVKYMNKESAVMLKDFADNNPNASFVDIICYATGSGVINSRQIEILIKIGFFSEYGYASELSRFYDVFRTTFKSGEAKQIKKDAVKTQEMFDIISRHSTDRNAKGGLLKSFTITDMRGILNDTWCYIKSLGLNDVSFRVKAMNQLEYLGYVDLTTGKEEDRRKLLITKIVPMKNEENNGRIWGYRVITKSIGSGKVARLTIRAQEYNSEPVKERDVVFAEDVSKNWKGYWYLNRYHIIG